MTGFVKTNGTVFKVDNNDHFRFVGANIRGLLYYGEKKLLKPSQTGDVETQLKAAKSMGAKVVRVFGADKYLTTEDTIGRLSKILQKMQEHDMYLIFSFTNFYKDGFYVQGDDEFYNKHGHLDYSWYTGGYKQHYLPFVEAIVREFKDNPRIFAWELGNELKVQKGNDVFPKLFIQFAQDVSKQIRRIDTNHMITTGVIDGGNLGCTDKQIETLYESFDFMTFHVYYPNHEVEAHRAEHETSIAKHMNKPFIIEEFGISNPQNKKCVNRTNPTQQKLQHWFDKGAAGVMQWGLMGTDYDNGDGDSSYGVDRVLPCHNIDYQPILKEYREQADKL